MADQSDQLEMADQSDPSVQKSVIVILVLVGGAVAWMLIGQRAVPAPPVRTWVGHGVVIDLPARGLEQRGLEPAGIGVGAGLEFDGPEAVRIGWYTADAGAGEPPRIEIAVRHAPSVPALAAVLALERRMRFGSTHRAGGSRPVVLRPYPGHAWLRTPFAYQVATLGHARTVHAWEYAIVQGDRLYRVTMSGAPGDSPERVREWVEGIAPGLRLALAGATRPLLEPEPDDPAGQLPDPVAAAADAVVMVLAADVRAGVVHVRAQGSGVVISADGVLLGSLHVLYDEAAHQLHDLFFIGRSRGLGQVPEFACLGRPDAGALDQALDLALMRCERGLSEPASASEPWSGLAPRPGPASANLADQDVYVIGFPDGRGGRLHWTRGAAMPDTGEPDSTHLRTTAVVGPGMSGGAAVSASGELVGLASAYRHRVEVARSGDLAAGAIARIERIGLIRPISAVHAWLQRDRIRLVGPARAPQPPEAR